MKSGCKLVGVRRRWALISAVAAVGLPVVGTAIPALGDITITFGPGSTQMFLPQTGTYTLNVAGAQGGATGPYSGGFGALIEGTTTNFTSRDSISFYVGGQGTRPSDFTLGAGGGGGSFIYDNSTSSLMVAAGGGGGAGGAGGGGAGQITNVGTAGSSGLGDTGGAAGATGNGGQVGTGGDGAGGGGFLTAGQTSTGFGLTATGGGAYSGFAGGTTTETGLNQVTGGFGGGGASGIESGGGGGGYSGGGGGGGSGGGGGGSFIAPSVIASGTFAGSNSSDGYITFSPTTFNMTIVYGATGTIAGAISGGGAVNMTGNGNAVLTSTGNSWTGGMTISAGTITVGDGGNDGSLPGNVTNNSKLVFNSSGTVTASGNLSGTGTLTQSGTGTTILSGTNTSYTGITTISAGTLQLGNSSNGIVAGNIVDNAALVFSLSGQQPYGGVVSGSGSVTTIGTGVLNLSKQQTYGGSTTIENVAIVELIANALPSTTNLNLTSDFQSNGGDLALAGVANGAQTVASLSGDSGVVSLGTNAVFMVNQSINTTFAGSIDDATQIGSAGTGKLVKSGSGTLTLTGTNIYAGGTTISGGSLQIGNGGTTGSVTGNFTDNANLTFDRSDSITFSGNVGSSGGSGSLTQAGTGTVAITGACTYTGGTTISAGSLQLGNGGSTGSITGNITDNANFTFDLSSSPTISSKISGSGSLTQSGSGVVTLTSSNTYTGNTTINAGVLVAGVTNALPTTTNLIMNSGYLGLNTNVTQTVASLSGAGSGIGMSPNGILIVNQSTNTEFDGNLYDGNSFGQPSDVAQLIKQGNGKLILTGANIYGGGTTISAGTLQVGNGGSSGSIYGNILDNAQLTYKLNSSSTVSGLISGAGALTQAGSSTLVLTANNTYTGGTTINPGGALQLGNGGTTGALSSTGAIVDNGNLTFDRTDSLTFANYIHGNGSLTQAGAGTVTLSTSNSYLGATSVTAGKLIIGAVNGIAQSPVSISGGGVLQLAPNTGEEDITALRITAGSTFDINNNHVFINYGSGPDPIASIAALIASGYAGGTWTGAGITSTAAQSNAASYGIAYADSADPNNPAGLASGTIEIMYTLLGDANLDGAVNGSDFAILASNFNKADLPGHSGWDEGDFDYSGSVNGADFAALASNFNKGASQASDIALTSFASANGLLADVPEPATSSLLLITGAGIFLRRRRRQLS